MFGRTKAALVGRKITCSLCAFETVRGTSRVCRKVLFHFCPECWLDRQDECCRFMDDVSRVDPMVQERAA